MFVTKKEYRRVCELAEVRRLKCMVLENNLEQAHAKIERLMLEQARTSTRGKGGRFTKREPVA